MLVCKSIIKLMKRILKAKIEGVFIYMCVEDISFTDGTNVTKINRQNNLPNV